MVNIYDLSKSDFDKHVSTNNENLELSKLLKNVPETEYNIIMRILKRANSSPTNYYSQPYADFMSSISTLDNDGYVKLFKELLNAYEISTKDVLSMNETRLVIFNKLRDAQNVYTEKFKDGKIKIEDANADNFDEGDDEGDDNVEVDKNTTKSKTKKSSSKQTEPKASKATTEPVTKGKKKKDVEPEPELKAEPEPKVESKAEPEPKAEPKVEPKEKAEPKEKGKRVKKTK